MELSFSKEQISRLEDCAECPRRCHANRFNSEGYCKSPPVPKLSSANLHYGEEPPISGVRGSGTIFLAGCNMSCVYCQNYPISQFCNGRDISLEDLVSAMLSLQSRGAHNINFVTPSHATVALESAIPEARKRGLKIPIIYNTSGYDSLEQLHRLEGLIQIYMPDIRYQNSEIAKELSNAPDYHTINKIALKEMQRQVGDLVFDKHGIAVRGLLVRHLVLPGNKADTERALKFIVDEISPNAYVSLMAQYFPAHKATSIFGMNRRISNAEWNDALELFRRSGLNGWAQVS